MLARDAGMVHLQTVLGGMYTWWWEGGIYQSGAGGGPGPSPTVKRVGRRPRTQPNSETGEREGSGSTKPTVKRGKGRIWEYKTNSETGRKRLSGAFQNP